jgi:hypothetical protein
MPLFPTLRIFVCLYEDCRQAWRIVFVVLQVLAVMWFVSCYCHSFVAALSEHLQPNLGVVGLACDLGNDPKSIFVHQTDTFSR